MPVKFKNSININDQYTLPTQDGTSGQALITDGSGNISFSSTGVPAPLYIDYTNNRLGIGTTSPSSALHISNTTPEIYLEDSNNTADAKLLANNGNLGLFSDVNNEYNSSIMYFSVDGSEKMRIASDGKVGIGTSSPASKLTVDGDSSFSGNVTTPQINLNSSGGGVIDNQTGNIFIQTPSGTGWIFRNGASGYDEKMRITSAGNVGIGTTSPGTYYAGANNLVIEKADGAGLTIASNATSDGSIYFADGITGAQAYAGYLEYNHSSDFFRVGVNGTEKMRIKSNGNVGIGTTNPSQKLHVNGNIAVSGTVDGVDISALPTTFAPTNAEQNVNADWTSTSGGSQILNNPGTSYLTGVTDRHVFPGLGASAAQARKHHIGRVYYCPKHWDTTWQNIYFTLNEETYNSGYVKYHLYGYYNGTENQTLNLKVVDYRGNNSDIQKYKIVLGDHTDAGWDHSNQNVYYTDIYVEVSYYKSVKVVVDALGHSILHANPTSGAGITVIYPTPTVTNITYTNETYDTTYLGSDTKIWNEANDGAGSGLDADKLDGQEGSHYLDYGNFTSTPTIPTDFVSAANGGTFAGDVTVGGNLIVNGTTTTLNTQTVEVEDNILQLNTTQGTPDTATAATSGISVYRGNGVTQASLIFDEADDTWDLTNNLQVAGDLTVLGGDIVLSGTGRIQGIDTVTASTDAVNKSYVDSVVATPVAPTNLSLTIVGETVNVTFDKSTTADIDLYFVFASSNGSDYSLISVLPPDDHANTMSIIDDSFDDSGTQAYRVYAQKNGVISANLNGNISYSVTSPLEPTNLSVVSLNSAYYVQWDPPSSNFRFITAYNVYKHEHASSGSLARLSASLVYSGMNTSYMYQISGADNTNYHQFWVETTTT